MKYIQTILTIAAIGLFTACSKDSVENQSEPLTDASIKMLRATRTDPVGDDTYGDIKVFLAEGEDRIEGLFKYAGASSWTTHIKLKSGEHSLRLYGIMPDDANVNMVANFYNLTGSLRLENMAPMSNNDYCVVTGLRQVTSETDETPAVRGNFSFTYKSNRDNYINLLFEHLCARLVFRMNVAADYAALRTIKVRRMRLEVPGASQFRTVVLLDDNIGITSVTYTCTEETNTGTLTFMEGETTLTTDLTDVASVQVIPHSTVLSGLTLITEYDVYDKQGNKVAERTATNKLVEPLAELQRAEERTLSVTVDPSYLYVLSEQDPPAVVIRKL